MEPPFWTSGKAPLGKPREAPPLMTIDPPFGIVGLLLPYSGWLRGHQSDDATQSRLEALMDTHPPEDSSASTELSALLRAIKQLTAAATEVAEAIKNHPLTTFSYGSIVPNSSDVKIKKKQEKPMPALPKSLTAIPTIEVIEVNAPQIYVKFHCHVCTREWIVPIPLEYFDTYQPPKKCRWCESVVWSNPERAQIRSDQRSKRGSVMTPSQSR